MFISEQWVARQKQESLLISSWQRLVNLMAELCETPAGFIVQASAKEYRVIIANENPENPYAAGSSIDADINIFCRKVVALNKPLYEGQATVREEWQDNPEVSEDGFNTYLGYPLHWPDGSVFGTICVMDLAKTDYDQRYYQLLNHFRDMAERELELCDKNIELKSMAYTDDLTKTLNRKGFFEKVKEIFNSHDNESWQLNVCYFDIDNLKPINDRYGHQVGDTTIQSFAEHLQEVFAEGALVARFGGDEFVVLCLNSDGEVLQRQLQQLRNAVAKQMSEPKLEYSCGFVETTINRPCFKDIERVIGEADKQMYKNKPSRVRLSSRVK